MKFTVRASCAALLATVTSTITLALVVFHISEAAAAAVNNRPVIGVLAQKSSSTHLKYGEEYVMSEYIKYLEMAGASVVVVRGNQPDSYYKDLFKKLNGIMFPGGGADLETSYYAKSARFMYDMAIAANDKGDYFPIWGTCLGFEELTVLTMKTRKLTSTDTENLPLPLQLLASYTESRLLGNAPKEILYYLTHENVTANFHKWSLATKTFKQENSLNKFYRLISVNKGRDGLEFVSTMEAFNYPIYGTQWHPEKNIFVRRTDQNIPHSFHAVQVSQYFANFFVNEARKNFHTFPSEKERSLAVVENDKRIFIPENYVEDFFYSVTKAV